MTALLARYSAATTRKQKLGKPVHLPLHKLRKSNKTLVMGFPSFLTDLQQAPELNLKTGHTLLLA